MNKDEQAIFESIFMQVRWQRFTPHRYKQKVRNNDHAASNDCILEDFRNRRISEMEVCRYLGIHRNDLLSTLVKKGELFG